MHILLLSIAYPPEVRSASLLTLEFAQALHARGHRVTVVTSYPGYNLPSEARGRHYDEVTDEGGVTVVRVRSMPVHKVGLLQRGIAELSLPRVFSKAAVRLVKEPVDVIEVYSPPLTLGLAGRSLKRKFGCPLVVNVQDLFPQNAVDLGMLRPGPALWTFRAIEQSVYRGADAITVHSSGNRTFLLDKRGQPPNRVHVVPNWIDPVPFDATARTGRYREQYGLADRFVVLFAGVLGPAQGLDVVVDAAWELHDFTDVVFLLVGDGTEKARLQEKVRARGQRNVQFESFVSEREYPALVKDADVGLLSISGRYHTPVVPGKMLGYMAGGLPVVASLNVESDGHAFLKASGGGFSVLADNVPDLVEAVRRLRGDTTLRATMATAGRAYVAEHCSRDRCVAQYEQLFETLVRR